MSKIEEEQLSEEGKLIMSLPVACRCHECTMYKMKDNPEHGACPIVKLQSSENATHCAYCGEEFPLDTVTADQVGEHIDKCPKHPIAALKKQIAELEYQHEADTSTIGILADVVDVLWEDDRRCLNHGYGDVVAKAREVVARATKNQQGIVVEHAIITDNCRHDSADSAVLARAVQRITSEALRSMEGWKRDKGTQFHLVFTVEPTKRKAGDE